MEFTLDFAEQINDSTTTDNMTSSTFNKEELTKKYEASENAMFERKGFGRKNIRYEFANVKPLDLNDRFIEHGSQTFVDADTTEMPYGPTGIGEVGGSGVGFIEMEGKQYPTRRFTQGFSTQIEDIEAGAVDPAEQRNKVLEMFDFFGDAMFLKGIGDRNGNVLKEGALTWLKTNIPASRTFDLSQYDGDTDEPDYTGGRAGDILSVAGYGALDGRIVGTSGRFGPVIGSHAALSKLNGHPLPDSSADTTYYDLLSSDEEGDVGVTSKKMIPDQLTFSDTHPDQNDITVDLSDLMGDNELLVLPQLDSIRDRFFDLAEMPSPRLWQNNERGGRVRNDYIWRYAHDFDPDQRYSDAPGCIHLTSIDSIFS